MQRKHIALTIFILLLTACLSPLESSSPTPLATGTPVPTNTSTPFPTDTPTEPSSTPVPIPPRPIYTLNTIFDYDRHFVSVDETILYPNHTDESLASLTLAIAANLWPNCFQLASIFVDGIPVTDFALVGHRLAIPLPTPLEPASVSELHLRYGLSLPYADQAQSLRARIFGYGDLQTNLTNWYPFVVPFMDGEWTIREPWSHGEYLVYPLADFIVDLKFVNPDNAPIVAASGAPESNGEYTRYTLTAGRIFALSASRDFEVASLKVEDVRISSYFFPIYRNAGEGALVASKQAIEVFSQRFG
ncbi:MAG: hypothetical protein WBL25_02755, partial [Anaerolineales bacterium]